MGPIDSRCLDHPMITSVGLVLDELPEPPDSEDPGDVAGLS